MQKAIVSFLLFISAVGILAGICWLFLVIGYLANTGATYSIDDGQGNMACGIPIFTRKTWLSASLLLFGIPLALIASSALVGRYGMRRWRTEMKHLNHEVIEQTKG